MYTEGHHRNLIQHTLIHSCAELSGKVLLTLLMLGSVAAAYKIGYRFIARSYLDK
jgi:hypothetical protein